MLFCHYWTIESTLGVVTLVMALGHYMRENRLSLRVLPRRGKHLRKRCEMPPRKHARESA